jgi:N-methylhydantoinase B
VRVLADDVVLANLGDRYKIAPPGLYGGSPGARARTVVNPGEEELEVDSKGIVRLQRGDLISYELSGGGGYGDPRKRSPELVARDVRWGLLSEEQAAETYGVVIDAPLPGESP